MHRRRISRRPESEPIGLRNGQQGHRDVGIRGLDNAGLDSDFQGHDPDEYIEHANRETFLTVQLETPEAIANVDSIAAVKGVDILFIGTGDLGMRIRRCEGIDFTLGHQPAFDERVDELVEDGYLKELPMDPFSDGALGYFRDGGDFVLYSFGGDMKDDGGQMGTKQGKPFKWADNGDWVFWPVE